MLRPFRLHELETVSDAVTLLGRYGPEASIYAGGTELLLAMKEGLLRYSHLLNIKTIPGLDRLEYHQDRGELHIGPAVTHRTLEQSPIVASHFPLIAQAEAHVANVRVRNVGTVGGNLCFAEPHSDPGAFLLLHEAHVEAQGPSGSRTIPLGDLIVGPYETCLEEDEVLTGIVVPRFPQGMTGAYLKFGYHARPTLGLGVALRFDSHEDSKGGSVDGRATVLEARVSVGSAGPRPVRVPEAEELLQGKTVGDLVPSSSGRSSLVDQAGDVAAQEAEPEDDFHGSAEYKEHLIRVLLGRAIKSVIGDAQAAHI